MYPTTPTPVSTTVETPPAVIEEVEVLPVETVEPVTHETNEVSNETVETNSSFPQINGERQYPSLYDSYGTTFIAVVLATIIVSSIIGVVSYIYHRSKSDHAALTQFVTTMFALIAGVFVADKIVAGPSTELFDAQESLKVLEFIQQTCLMVFAYYFGTKAQQPKDDFNNQD